MKSPFEEKTFKELVTGLFAYSQNPSITPHPLLLETVKRINKSYELVGLVGIGKEGAILKVKDLSNNEIALKVASPSFSEKGKQKKRVFGLWNVRSDDENTFKKRFVDGCVVQRELSEIVQIEGVDYIDIPGSVEVFDSPGLYVKMKYLHGVDVLRHISEKKDFKYSMLVFIQLLRCVNFIHEYGYIHRDLKPENIIVTGSKNQLKLGIVDWTVAKKCGIESSTLLGTHIGTVPYGSDKLIIDGEAKDANYTDDIAPLGVMMYEFCNFCKVPKPKNPEILQHDPAAKKEYLDYLRNSIPDFLIPIYQKATEQKEEKRYQSVQTFLYELIEAVKQQGLLEEGDWDYIPMDKKDLTIDALARRVESIEKVVRRLEVAVDDFTHRFDAIASVMLHKSDCTRTQRFKRLEPPVQSVGEGPEVVDVEFETNEPSQEIVDAIDKALPELEGPEFPEEEEDMVGKNLFDDKDFKE